MDNSRSFYVLLIGASLGVATTAVRHSFTR
jgi:hypothetical protein